MKGKQTKLHKLQELCKSVARELEDEPLLDGHKLSENQRSALDETLRYLDASREYKVGYLLRQAFGVETDNERGKGER